MSIAIELMLAFAGMIVLFKAGEFDARDGGANHRMLWALLSLVASGITFSLGFGIPGWLLGQAMLFIVIAAVRVWIEDRTNK